jgi:triacylglycerol lipase
MSATKLSDSDARVNVVLLHGLGDTNRVFKYLKPYLEARGRVGHCLDLVPNNGSAGLDELAAQVKSYTDHTFGAGEAFDLVGFSMGGLVARYYVQRLGGMERVRRLVTISSPHGGTFTAYLLWNRGVRQMRPGSEFLRDLDADRETLARVGFTSIWTPRDLMIVPAKSSSVPGVPELRIPVPFHARMAKDERVLAAVADALR